MSSKGNLQNMNQMGKKDQGIWKMPISRYHALTNGNDSCRVWVESARRFGLISPSH